MDDFKKRLQIEYDELVDKLAKLESFLGTEQFYKLSDEFQSLLIVQAGAMNTYILCLRQRLIKL